MRDITSTFLEFHEPSRRRRLPSEAASEDLFEGVREAMHGDGLVQPRTGPDSVEGQRSKFLAGGLRGLSKMADTPPMPMSPIMMSDPIQLDEMAISRATGLRGYYQGGRIRRGQAGVVGDEIVEVDEEGATVIPAERMVSRTPEGELDVDARYEDAVPSGGPDTRGLLSRPSGYEDEFGEQLGIQQTADPLAQKEAELAEAMVVKPSAWKDYGYALVSGVNNYFNKTNDNRTYSEIKRDRRVAQIAPQVELMRQKRKQEQDAIDTQINRDYKVAQTRTIPIDDENRRLQIEGQQAVAAQRGKDTALGQLTKLKHYDPQNTAHKKLAERAGLDPEELTGWDDRNPYTKAVAGTTYIYDRTDQTFKPSNLPADESATLTDYQVKMPNGEFRTYKVAQKDAARFATQMQVLGAQIEAAAQRQQAGFQQAANMETLRQQGQQTLAKLRSELAEGRAMSAADRKKKEKQVSELEILLQAKGEAIPNQ